MHMHVHRKPARHSGLQIDTPPTDDLIARSIGSFDNHFTCRDGFSVLYRRAPRLFADLATARGEGRLARLMRSLERTRLLIIDDWGPEPLNAEQRRDLLEIVDDREGKGSLLITSQVPIGRWHEIIGEPSMS